MTKPIRVLVVDDHAVVRKGVVALLGTRSEFEVVGEAEDGEQAVEAAVALRPDVILLDLSMPRMDGIAAINEIKELTPDSRILVLTSYARDDKVFAAIRSGALGYLLKDASADDLLNAIMSVHEGQPTLMPVIAQKLVREIRREADLPLTSDPLTEREVEVLRLVALGLSNEEIAEKLVVSDRTVGVHISRILAKLHLANRTQAALYALREGLAALDWGSGTGT